MIAAGKLDRLITIQVNTPVQDSTGEYVAGWSNLAQVWGKQVTQKPAEFYRNFQRQAEKVVLWQIRWRSDVGSAHLMRVLYNSQVYDVIGYEEIGRQAGIYLHTEIRTVV